MPHSPQHPIKISIDDLPVGAGAGKVAAATTVEAAQTDVDNVNSVIRTITIGTFSAEVANVRTVPITVASPNGPVVEVRRLRLRLWDDAAFTAAAANAVGALAGGGAGVVLSGGGTNDLVVQTGGAGVSRFDLAVTDAAVETVFVTAEPAPAPNPDNALVAFAGYDFDSAAFA